MSPMNFKQRLRLAVGGVLLTLLLAAVFTLGSLDMPFEPKTWPQVLTLYAVSSFITAALIVFGLVLMRTVLRLWNERNKQQLGARFKTKMVLGAMVISLLPIFFMFIVSYSLLNRTLARWFPRPLELAVQETRELLADFGRVQLQRMNDLGAAAVASSGSSATKGPASQPGEWPARAVAMGADAAWLLHEDGSMSHVLRRVSPAPNSTQTAIPLAVTPRRARTLPSGAQIWLLGQETYIGNTPLPSPNAAVLVVARRLPQNFLQRYAEVDKQSLAYGYEKQHLRALKTQMLQILLLFTLLLLFAALWMALFLAKQVTVPIQALAEGTREISSGNFDYQVPEQAQDELGVLVRSFNAMTTQLRDSRRQIDEFTRSLQQAVQELERRRQLMETILENIPTGVISLDASGAVLRTNPAMTRITGEAAGNAQNLEQLLGPDAARLVHNLMRRAQRMGVVTREIELIVQGRVLHAAVTVSSLGPRRANTGYVVVLDDLTEVLRAQKSAAWQEVAKRIAHEIKNPLTPIQLSAQRLTRFLERRGAQPGAPAERDPELARLVQECSQLIEREVATLASLVNEFSQFVRFPTAKLGPTDANQVIREALEVFAGRLDGVSVQTQLEVHLPAVRGDGGLLRSVFVNLIDNAAEALENARVKQIRIATRAIPDAEMVEIRIEDTGHGISPEDKDKLFLPTFSTKERGTGLGLAIAARIIAEHGGTIRVEDNRPVGSRFFIELPVIEPVPAPSGEGV
ncbi:MAG: HAMP domain-containing protein [Acidobacteriia bacterium]|nr:HAMP domain-containing protein [Terriglobia bacterium]